MTVSQGVGCKSKKLKKSHEEWQKNIAEMEELGLWFTQSSLIVTSNHKEVLLQPVQTTINLKSKLLSNGIEPWFVM